MRRLLLPLLAALALPTAVNAFPFGNDVQITDDVGRKTSWSIFCRKPGD